MGKKILIILSYLVLLNYCLCWWDLGHMLVAKIAEITLTQEDPDAFDLGNRIASILNVFSHGKVNNFVESACWPDDLKTFSLHAMDDWHFIDVAINTTNVIDYINATSTPDDAIGILTTANRSLNSWKEIEVTNLSQEFEKSLLMRYLIHVLGDIHQPLHTSTLVNEKFPDGDQGGNLFKIDFSENIDNLHKLFDSGANKLGEEIKRPLSHESGQMLESLAIQFITQFPRETLPETRVVDFKEWVVESTSISKDFVYKEIDYGKRPSEEYMKKAYEMIKRRIALGGYRLAELIKNIKKSYDNYDRSRDNNHNNNSNNHHNKFLYLADK